MDRPLIVIFVSFNKDVFYFLCRVNILLYILISVFAKWLRLSNEGVVRVELNYDSKDIISICDTINTFIPLNIRACPIMFYVIF